MNKKSVCVLTTVGLLCCSLTVSAQETLALAQKSQEAQEAQEDPQPVADTATMPQGLAARIQKDTVLASPVSPDQGVPLQASSEELQYLQQAGVCSVITNYLYSVCLQETPEAGCKPYN